MPNLKIQKIIFGDKEHYHFVTVHSGEHETSVIEDRHDIDVEVMVPVSAKLEDVEKIALEKAKRFIKELASAI